MTLATTALLTGCSGEHPSESARATSQALSAGVVISHVYGGGGNAGALFRNDFVELFNRGSSPVALNGLSLQYASAGGTTWTVSPLASKTIDPGRYYLVQLAGGANGDPLPAADDTSALGLGGTSGKLALVSGTTPLACAADAGADASVDSGRCVGSAIDLVGYGTASDFEGTGPSGALSSSLSAARNAAGCMETDDNAADFTAGTVTAPRNSASPATDCSLLLSDGGKDASEGGASTGDGAANDGTANDAGIDSGPADDGAADSSASDDGSAPDGGTDGGTDQDGGTVADASTADGGPADASTADGGPADGSPDSGSPTGDGTGLVLSQIYGGGGNSGATFNRDFVELFNRTTAPVSLAGLSIQYGSAAGNFATTLADGGVPNLVPLPDVMVPAGRYFLVAMGTPSASVGAALPMSDFQGTAALSASDGKIALARITTSLACGATANRCPLSNIVDMIGYGSAADFEGAAAAAGLSSTKASLRNADGCVDTNNNASDTTAALPAPRNASTAPHDCTSISDAGAPDSGRADAGHADAGHDGGHAADAGGSTPPDAGIFDPDSGPVSGGDIDAGLGTTPGTDGGSRLPAAEPPVDPSAGDCSCRTVGAPAGGTRATSALSLMAALGLVFAARRRRSVLP